MCGQQDTGRAGNPPPECVNGKRGESDWGNYPARLPEVHFGAAACCERTAGAPLRKE